MDGDTLAYWFNPPEPERQPDPDEMFPPEIVITKRKRYKGVFLLDRLSNYEQDYARVEDSRRAEEIHNSLGNAYRLFGYEPIQVPVFSGRDVQEQIDIRAQFVIDQMTTIDPSVPNLPIMRLL